MTRDGFELFGVIVSAVLAANAGTYLVQWICRWIAGRWRDRQDRLRAEAYARECENEELPF